MNQAIACEPKVFDLIVYLIENNERLVGREELFEKIWYNREISDTTLSNHIKTARKILGDNGQAQAVIKTTRGRGYQFVAPIKQESANKSNNEVKKSPWILRSVLLLITVFLLSNFLLRFSKTKIENISQENYLIAVLPFSNTKPSLKTNYLGLAVADHVITELTYFENINVSPSISVRKFNNINLDYQKIRKELNVNYILTGTYLSVDDLVRFNIELVNVKNNELVWRSKQIELVNQDAFQLQDTIAKQVLKGLKLKLPITKHKKLAEDELMAIVAGIQI